MSKGETRRNTIFNKYSKQLRLLMESRLIDSSLELKYDDSYICPICLKQFTRVDLDQNSSNPLTLEDAPQKSLGGRAATLTCKSCNNSCGENIDAHLTNALIERDKREFLPNSKGSAKFEIDGKTVNGYFEVDVEGNITVTHLITSNNPQKLENYIDTTKKGSLITISHKERKIEENWLLSALLKTAYILAFEKFGYLFILDKNFDSVRKQILNPSEEHYPEGFWTKQNGFKEEHEGVHYINDQSYRGMYSIFALKTPSQINRFGVYLPLPKVDFESKIENLKKLEAGSSLSFTFLNDKDFIEDLKAIQELKETLLI